MQVNAVDLNGPYYYVVLLCRSFTPCHKIGSRGVFDSRVHGDIQCDRPYGMPHHADKRRVVIAAPLGSPSFSFLVLVIEARVNFHSKLITTVLCGLYRQQHALASRPI